MRSGLERARNVEAALALIDQAAEQGARFVATPEMTTVLDRDPARLFAHLDAEEGLFEIEAFAAAAQRSKLYLLIGSMAIRTGERRAANRSFLFGPDGRIIARYDKLHMFDVDLPGGETWRESAVYDAGDTAVVVKTPLAAFGMGVCYDLRFPTFWRRLAQAGADVLLVPAAFTRQTGIAHWRTLLTARAIECGAFVVAPAQGGVHEDGRSTYGHSLVIDPWGNILAERADDTPGLLFADLDIVKAAETRRRIPNLALEKSFETVILHG